MNFKDFYNGLGLNEYPFSVYTTELEQEKAEKLFVKQSKFSLIQDALNNGQNIIILGERGSGKTAILEEFRRLKMSKHEVFAKIDDYTEMPSIPKQEDIYKLILRNLTLETFLLLEKTYFRRFRLNKGDKIFLSFLLNRYSESSTGTQLKEEIENIQVDIFGKLTRYIFNKIRIPLNYSATVGANFVYQYLLRNFSFLPPVETRDSIVEFFPEFNYDADFNFLDQKTSFNMIKKLCKIVFSLTKKYPAIFFDRLDEKVDFENSAEPISEFIKPFLTDSNLLNESTLQTIFFIWKTPFRHIESVVRTQKYFCPDIIWGKEDLEKALNRRLAVYSNNKITHYRKLFAEEIGSIEEDLIFNMANSNPRDLWHIFNYILNIEFNKRVNGEIRRKKITKNVIKEALDEFVTKFNYYEYYPRKDKARANSMDIYSYSNYLMKLNQKEFTKNELSSKAGTGGSTQNYVIGMENIGLIQNIDKKFGNAVYRIQDPKIIYAMENQLDINSK